MKEFLTKLITAHTGVSSKRVCGNYHRKLHNGLLKDIKLDYNYATNI